MFPMYILIFYHAPPYFYRMSSIKFIVPWQGKWSSSIVFWKMFIPNINLLYSNLYSLLLLINVVMYRDSGKKSISEIEKYIALRRCGKRGIVGSGKFLCVPYSVLKTGIWSTLHLSFCHIYCFFAHKCSHIHFFNPHCQLWCTLSSLFNTSPTIEIKHKIRTIPLRFQGQIT